MSDNGSQNVDDWTSYTVSTEGVRVGPDSHYHCEECDERLTGTGRIKRDGRYPEGKWVCPSCESIYWVSFRDPIPKYDLTEEEY